jgi:hypothetical protein
MNQDTLFYRVDSWLTANIHPAMTWGLLTLAVFVVVWATRKWTPGVWVWLDKFSPDGSLAHVVQGLPSVGLGALASVFMFGGDFGEAWKGAIAGALAPFLHLFMKKYNGHVKGYGESAGGGPPPTVSPKEKAAAVGGIIAALVFVLVAVGSFLAAAGCSTPSTDPGACAPGAADAERARVGTEYLKRLETECAGYGAPSKCPAYEGIRADYLQKRAAYTECQR